MRWVITITLLAFIVVLLIGLASYTRIEAAIAGNTQRQAQARDNALMALDIALGQLQKHAGPDQRVTATADSFGGGNGTRYYTGVWDATPVAAPVPDPNADPNAPPVVTPPDVVTPLTWLVSGNEFTAADGTANPLAVKPGAAGNTTVQLVGAQSATGAANFVVAPLQNITSVGVPGTTGPTSLTVGKYAWWVGDQGVKAPVALGDVSGAVNYAPYGDGTAQLDLGGRIRQQVSLGAGAATAAGAPVFEPRDTNNSPLIPRVASTTQMAFLRNTSNSTLGLATIKNNFHTWSPNNFAVLANTKLGGLKKDLSSEPAALGADVQNWLNFPAYTEPAVAGGANPPAPDYGADPVRRRVVFRGTGPNISPVLSYFLLSFNIKTQGTDKEGALPVEVRARWMLSLWNPYTSAVVPEELRVEVTGLPTLIVDDDDAPEGRTENVTAPIDLNKTFNPDPPVTPTDPTSDPTVPSVVVPSFKIDLPWAQSATAGSDSDKASWLPGRVYTWTAQDSALGKAMPAAGYPSKFYSRDLAKDAPGGVEQPVAGGATLEASHRYRFDVPNAQTTTLTVTIYAVRADGDVKLGTFTSPAFDRLNTTPQELYKDTYQFSYVFRLGETTGDGVNWLTTAGIDPHSGALDANAYVYEASVTTPTAAQSFPDFTAISAPDRLLDRDDTSTTYNEDVPVFELPRGAGAFARRAPAPAVARQAAVRVWQFVGGRRRPQQRPHGGTGF